MLNKRLMRIGFAVGLVGALAMPSAFATAVLEGDSKNGAQEHFNIELIEGEEKVAKQAPVPHAYYAQAQESSYAAASSGSTADIPQIISRYNRSMHPTQIAHLSNSIQVASNSYNVDARLMASVVAVESSFNPRAVSRTGAMGLGQLKPATAKWLGVSDPFDPQDNLMGMAKYLRFLLDKYNGSVQHALAAYFQGQGTIDRRGIDAGAMNYIVKVGRVLRLFY